jgi:hypothetical protein
MNDVDNVSLRVTHLLEKVRATRSCTAQYRSAKRVSHTAEPFILAFASMRSLLLLELLLDGANQSIAHVPPVKSAH